MQKQNKKQFHHRHHVRVSTFAITLACSFHVSGLTHMGRSDGRGAHETAMNFSRALSANLERENETARHMVRFDEGLRLPSISGGEV